MDQLIPTLKPKAVPSLSFTDLLEAAFYHCHLPRNRLLCPAMNVDRKMSFHHSRSRTSQEAFEVLMDAWIFV